MDNISQIISRSIGGYSIGSILSALLTFLICLIVVRLVLKLCSRLLSRANRLNERLQNALASENIVSIEAYRPICDLLSDSWQDVYRELDAAHKKAFWRSIIKEIHVDPETRKISGFRLNA